MKFMEAIAKRIFQLMKDKHIDKMQFCDKINLSIEKFERIIRGQNPYLMTKEIKNIVRGFDLTLPEFFNSELFNYQD